MLCEKILGTLSEPQYKGKLVDYVDIDWHETYNKLLRKTSRAGRDVAIRLGDEVLKTGMKPGDILGIDEDGTLIVVDVLPADVLIVTLTEPTPFNVAKAAYEIGNCHAPLFAGQEEFQFVTIFNEPMEHLLHHLHGVKVEQKTEKLDFSKQISSIVGHGHHHH